MKLLRTIAKQDPWKQQWYYSPRQVFQTDAAGNNNNIMFNEPILKVLITIPLTIKVKDSKNKTFNVGQWKMAALEHIDVDTHRWVENHPWVLVFHLEFVNPLLSLISVIDVDSRWTALHSRLQLEGMKRKRWMRQI